VHGGGFTVGSRAMKPMRLLATACRRAGWASLTFDYRLVPRGGGARTFCNTPERAPAPQAGRDLLASLDALPR